ncbi:NPCBM/NEW2 domain protein [Gimesia aquarii]|uniref:NPCBM/NEW2 domain protein n=2 Tax=Gimesia aquarii TaxID=2527964 RepID=A0A517VU33_9PLAN|nr:NPCBM/NEW2 domain protein [Gimesia aquarii]
MGALLLLVRCVRICKDSQLDNQMRYLIHNTFSHKLLVVVLMIVFLGTSYVRGADPSSQKINFTERYKELLLESQKAPTKEYMKEVAFDAMDACQTVIKAGDYATALKFAALAVKIAKLSGNNHAITSANRLKLRSSLLNREYRKVEKNHKKLKQDVNDSKSATIYGKFVALYLNQWKEGLFWLAKGDDTSYRTLAKKELSNSNDEATTLAIANGWLQLAENEKGLAKRTLELHAYDLYRRAWSSSLGADRARIDAMMNKLPIRYLNHMVETDVNKGPWPLGKNGSSGNGNPIFTVNNLEFPNGLGLHPPDNGSARVRYNLNSQYKTFETGIAIMDDTYVFRGTIYFWVVGDGKVLWKSAPIRGRGDVQYCRVSVKNVKTLELRTESPGRATGAHAVWLDPHVLKY